MVPTVYATGGVKEEPVVETTDDPLSPNHSPPRKRYRLMAASLPSSTPPSSFPPNGSGVGGDQSSVQQQQQQPSHQQHDWHRNHRTDHHSHSGYNQPVWPNAGWINTSYPVGLAQLEEIRYDDNNSPDAGYEGEFSPLIGVSIGRASSPSSASSPSYVQQRRLLLRRKQHQPVLDSMDVLMTAGRYRTIESAQRVPDVSITVPPELSPLGYVLTPAPTPPDTEDGPPSIGYQPDSGNGGSAVDVEQRVPASLSSETAGMSFINAAVLNGQPEVVEPGAMVLANRHYLYHHATINAASVVPSGGVQPSSSGDLAPPGAVYQSPATPTSMDYPKP